MTPEQQLKQAQYDHEMMRRKVWIDAACSHSQTNPNSRPVAVAEFGDKVLDEYDKRFKPISR